MKMIRTVSSVGACLAVLAGGCGGQSESRLVESSDRHLRELAASLLPDLAARSGMELTAPVRLEQRSRAELVRYLEHKLDEELPPSEARARVDAYALLGLVPSDLDLRSVLLALYTEQVAGFYEPDSTALFVLDDQPDADVEALLVHELVHAVQDQSIDLSAITDPDLGNDRATAAHAAVEGHATLVMLEYMYEQAAGAPVDLSEIPDLGALIGPALEASAQFPALASAPRVIRESLIFPYVQGAGFVQGLWTRGERVAPFGASLPESTEEILDPEAAPPIDLVFTIAGGDVVLEDVLGRFELDIFLDEVAGSEARPLARGWEGDRYAVIESRDGSRGLVAVLLWEDEATRDAFVEAMSAPGVASRLGGPITLEASVVGDRAAATMRIGAMPGLTVGTAVHAR